MCISALFGLALLVNARAGAQEKNDPAEEKALQKRGEAFVAAFNKGDAKAVAAFFMPRADVVDTEGHHLKGREAIQESYQKLFAEAKGAKLFIRVTSMRIVRPDLALEDGLTEVDFPSGPPSAARYTVVYVKEGGEWFLESVREAIAVPPSNAEHLQDLAFLIGDWMEDAEKGSGSRMSYSWAEQGNFIVNKFELTMKDIPVGGGIQWIAWDATMKKPRSWAFVFNGSFAEGLWNKDGNKWRVSLTATMPDGSKITATNIITKIDADHFSFHFVDRTQDGKPLPDDKEVKMKRVK
jgi:uncharacterized protein (TIGR02246 family)